MIMKERKLDNVLEVLVAFIYLFYFWSNRNLYDQYIRFLVSIKQISSNQFDFIFYILDSFDAA